MTGVAASPPGSREPSQQAVSAAVAASIPNAVELVLVHDPNSDLWPSLERAAIRLSDAITGRGSRAKFGVAKELLVAELMQHPVVGIVDAVDDLNRVLRELSRRRTLHPQEGDR